MPNSLFIDGCIIGQIQESIVVNSWGSIFDVMHILTLMLQQNGQTLLDRYPHGIGPRVTTRSSRITRILQFIRAIRAGFCIADYPLLNAEVFWESDNKGFFESGGKPTQQPIRLTIRHNDRRCDVT